MEREKVNNLNSYHEDMIQLKQDNSRNEGRKSEMDNGRQISDDEKSENGDEWRGATLV